MEFIVQNWPLLWGLNTFKLYIASQGCQPALSGHDTKGEHKKGIDKFANLPLYSKEAKLLAAKNFLPKLTILSYMSKVSGI